MGRTVAVLWHVSFTVVAAGLYFCFTLPRWWELVGDTPHTLGTVLRIVTGVLIALAALPVVFTLHRTRRPEFGTPQLALTLRLWSIICHVLAGVLIVGAAISEIWLSLDDAGQWLFGIYGAAAAIAILGVFAFYLAFVAELPPPPPKPLKPKKEKKAKKPRGRRGAKAGEDGAGTEAGRTEAGGTEAEGVESEALAQPTTEETADEISDDEPADKAAEEGTSGALEDTASNQEDGGGLRNRRSAKTGKPSRRRLRRGVAVEE